MKILEVGKKGIDYDSYLRLQWSITNRCNYCCDYCNVYNQHDPIIDYSKWGPIVHFINNIATKRDVDLRIFGGEPTIHPDIVNILHAIKILNPILIWTNLSRSLDFLELLIRNKKFRFRCTFHPNYSDVYEFMSKLQLLLDRGNDVFVNSMISPEYPEIGFDCYNEIKKLKQYPNFNCSLDKIHYQDETNFNQQDQLKFDAEQEKHTDRGYYIKVREDGVEKIISIPYNQIIEKDLNNFYMYKCYTGPNSIYIDSNGDIYRCFTYKNSGKFPILNLLKDSFEDYIKFFKNPNLCLLKKCYCELDIKKEKFNEGTISSCLL
jgi:MoaA/NifB/PqqE/SkfB family radical SAM enzyme